MRKTTLVLAIVFAVGSCALFTAAFAGDGSDATRGYGDRGGRISNSHRGFDSYAPGYRDPWGHWGAYYGPMVGRP